MPSNTKGGKGYKKKKKQANTEEPIFIDRQVGQMPARAIRLLGNRNVLCYSNDNVLRLCHICGKMKGRVFIEPGDVVLITLREFGVDANKRKEVKNGDIIAKYASQQFAALKKEDGVNPKLFMKLETGGHCVGEIGTDYTDAVMNVPEDEGFDFEHSDSDSDSEHDIKESPKETIDIDKTDDDINIDDI
jgi:translation initiation factor 1A